MTDKLRLVFISHEASRTGAPILLLTILRWLKANKPCEIRIVLLTGGELEGEFQCYGPTLVVSKVFRNPILRRIFGVIGNRLSRIHKLLQETRLKGFIKRFNPGLIYANTAVSLSFAANNKLTINYKVLCHVHELEYSIDTLVGREAFATAVSQTLAVVCVAQVVKKTLIEHYGVEEGRTIVIPEPIHVKAQPNIGGLKKEIGIDEDAFVVMGAGTTGWRKGPDLFLMTAFLVNRIRPGVHFIWVGPLDWGMKMMFDHDIEKLKLNGFVHFVGPKSNPLEYFAMSDVFYLTSREDPYPLVCLEAASVGKPIICFADAGGMPEFVRDDCGYVVPYLDVNAAAQCIVVLMDNDEHRQNLGRCANDRVTRESDIEVVAPKIWQVIEHCATAESKSWSKIDV